MGVNEAQVLAKIEGRLGRLEALQESNIRNTSELTANVSRLVDKLDKSDDIAREADQRARSAHHRIEEANKKIDQVEADIKWLWRAVIGAGITGVVGGAIALIWGAISN